MKVKFQLSHACHEENENEVIRILNNNSDIDIFYDDGTYFKRAIRSDNLYILNALLNYYDKHAEKNNRENKQKLRDIFISASDGRKLSVEVQEVVDRIISENDDVESVCSDIEDIEVDQVWSEENNVSVDEDMKSVFTLSERALRPFEYKYYRNHLKDLNYKYWQLNLEAEKLYEEENFDECKEVITEAVNLVVSNRDMLTNSEYKTIVIYNYLRFKSADSFFDGIDNKSRLVKYLPSIHVFAEKYEDDAIRIKAFKLIQLYFGKEDNVYEAYDKGVKHIDIMQECKLGDPEFRTSDEDSGTRPNDNSDSSMDHVLNKFETIKIVDKLDCSENLFECIRVDLVGADTSTIIEEI